MRQNKLILELAINEHDYLAIYMSKKNRFSVDDVYIYVVTKRKRFLVLEDSFEYSAYIEITNSIDLIANSKDGDIQHVVGAPCSRGGLQLWFLKNNAQNVQLNVVKSKYETDQYKEKYSAIISFDMLEDWKIKLRDLYDRRESIF